MRSCGIILENPLSERIHRTASGGQGGHLLSNVCLFLVCILPTFVYDVRTFMTAWIAVENPQIQRPYPGGIVVGMDSEPERKTEYLQCEINPVDHRVGMILAPRG
jgi:hypothetical protein